MGREYIFIDEFKNALRQLGMCPRCGSTEFVAECGVKLTTTVVFKRDGNDAERVKEEVDEKEWEVVYYVGCAKCNADLSDYFGL